MAAVRRVPAELASLFRYEIMEEPPARGGFGEIWRATDRLFDAEVAVKTVRSEVGRAVRSFELEAMAGARLAHESRHIVKVLDIGRIDDLYYLVQEWIDVGADGKSDISSLVGACTLVRAHKVMTQCASAVALSHVHGIVHSDIAVWNVLHEPNDDIYKVGDFGLLKIVSSDLISAPSRSLLIGGRAAFLPPYARSDPSKIGRGSDVYAMAVMYWHLLEGERVLGHGDVVPGVVRVTAESRDAPAQVRQLLSRFIERHEEEDSVSDFLEFLGRVPTR